MHLRTLSHYIQSKICLRSFERHSMGPASFYTATLREALALFVCSQRARSKCLAQLTRFQRTKQYWQKGQDPIKPSSAGHWSCGTMTQSTSERRDTQTGLHTGQGVHGQRGLAMDEDKPWALYSVVGEHGYIQEATDIMKQHFQIVNHQDFLQNSLLLGPKIQALFLWNCLPTVEPSLLSSLPALKVVANGGVGIDHLDVPYINSLGVRVTNTPHVVSDATADIALGLLLASARRIVEGHQICLDPKTTHYPQNVMGFEVTGSTLGIIGMGHIGYKIAQRGRGFDMKILYHNRNRRLAEDEQAVGATYCKSMDDLLRQSDFVVLAVNLSPETTGLISHKELSLMKPTGTLVNVSRGRVVDQDALVQALQLGTIAAAALDVTYPEPLPRDHPLLRLPNVLITPHVGTNTFTTTKKMVQMMVDNAVAVIKGLPISNEVKPL